MKVNVYSKNKMETLLKDGPIKNTAVISFYNEPITFFSKPIDYTGKVERFVQINLPDITEDGFGEHGYTEETFFDEAETVAEFIYEAYRDGFDFICQCHFGFSRSAAAAAAILEHFEGRGNEIFSSENYQPNKIVFGKLLNALEKCKNAKSDV